ncbi:hypothetical protein AC1031_009266 [Aphanomyces cochlioides]|nr:hypothetical protein AC1031_009266 [Aphanomyces cochlioides]
MARVDLSLKTSFNCSCREKYIVKRSLGCETAIAVRVSRHRSRVCANCLKSSKASTIASLLSPRNTSSQVARYKAKEIKIRWLDHERWDGQVAKKYQCNPSTCAQVNFAVGLIANDGLLS